MKEREREGKKKDPACTPPPPPPFLKVLENTVDTRGTLGKTDEANGVAGT